jgi:gliding motility-associated-like protein
VKETTRFSITAVLFLLFTQFVYGQSLVINEVSQGPSGSGGVQFVKEYVELLVVPGTSPYSCSNYCMDIRGWIIDDNNGYFTGGGGTGLGIATGAFRFSNNVLWSCVPVGTIIVIYNDLDFTTTMPSDDISTSDGNCRLIVPISSNLIEGQTSSPTITNSNYPSNGWIAGGGLWGAIGMANGGDSFQIYNPANQSTPTHGVSWVNNDVNNIIYFATSATNSVYYFANTVDNNPANQANWISGTCSAPDDQTPGLPNNTANASYIASLTNNCAGPLVASISTSVDAGSCQCTGSATVNATGSIPGYTYAWYNSSNISIGQTTSSASNLCAGTYYCVVSSSINCLDTAVVTINSATNTILPNFNSISPICIGGTITFPTTSLNGITGTWLPAIDNTQTTNYTFTPDPNQCASTTTMTVVVSNGFTPTFNPISAICEGGTFSLPTISNEGVTGIWSPIINTSSTTQYTFTPDPNQCANTANLTVAVNPIPQISINENPTICQGQNIDLSTTSNLAGGTYLWNPGGETTSQITVSPLNTTSYSVVYSLNGCSSQPAVATVTVSSAIDPQFDSWGPFCKDAILVQVILPQTSLNGISGTWNPQMVSTSVAGTSTYVFTPNSNECANTFNLNVIVNPSPIIDAGNNLTNCEGNSVTLSANGGLQYVWTNSISNGTPFLPATTTTYYVTGTDVNGCEAIDSVTVFVLPNPLAVFTPNVTSGQAPLNIQFSNTSSNASSYFWDFGNGNTLTTLNLNPVNSAYNNPQTYTVWLVASNGICADSTFALINVLALGEPEISIPNVFSPNSDSINDLWYIDTKNMERIEILILNRWGNLIKQLNTISGSWDGKTDDGQDATEGTYFYKYSAKALNGKDFSGNGFITLIR